VRSGKRARARKIMVVPVGASVIAAFMLSPPPALALTAVKATSSLLWHYLQ
jgi:hypothetical protein